MLSVNINAVLEIVVFAGFRLLNSLVRDPLGNYINGVTNLQ